MNYQRLYEYRFRDVDQTARTAVWVEIARFMAGQLHDPEIVLDPAAGRGEFINAVAASERWAVDAYAYDEGTYEPGVKQVVSDIFDADIPKDHFEGIFVSNFLEHLLTQEQVAEFCEKMLEHLVPGGRIAVLGPNFRYCPGDYFDMADHTLALTERAVAEHLYAAGFEVERTIPRLLPYSFTGRLPPSPALTRQYLKMPFAWRFLGKQFLVVGRKG